MESIHLLVTVVSSVGVVVLSLFVTSLLRGRETLKQDYQREVDSLRKWINQVDSEMSTCAEKLNGEIKDVRKEMQSYVPISRWEPFEQRVANAMDKIKEDILEIFKDASRNAGKGNNGSGG